MSCVWLKYNQRNGEAAVPNFFQHASILQSVRAHRDWSRDWKVRSWVCLLVHWCIVSIQIEVWIRLIIIIARMIMCIVINSWVICKHPHESFSKESHTHMATAFEAPNESFCSSWLGFFWLLLLKILLYKKEATFAGTTSMSLIRSKSGRALVPICACILKVVLDVLLQVFRLFLPAQQWWYKLLGCADTRSDMIWELKKWQY